ncbi:MAG: hypothetical protein NZ739_11615, partial [Verrucomicrobiae bacterium]|nr:hypothetical protein [Verrucomicrobiae bacterium]
DGTDRAIRIKSARGRGGVVERIYARKMRAKNMKRELVILNMDYGSVTGPAPAGKPPVYKDMCFEDFSCEGAPTAILIRGRIRPSGASDSANSPSAQPPE